jgi:hypothetical protein
MVREIDLHNTCSLTTFPGKIIFKYPSNQNPFFSSGIFGVAF